MLNIEEQNSITKRFLQLSSAGHALGKKQNSGKFMSNHYVSSNCIFSDQCLVTILVLLVFLNFYFPYLNFTKLVSDRIESNPGPNINGSYWYLLKLKIWNNRFERIILCNMLFISQKGFCLGKKWYRLYTRIIEW